jgi:hypothetical protein
MKKFWLGIIGWLVLISASQAENALIPIQSISGSIAPYVDKDGYVNPIISLGDINFGGGLTLPLVLNFSSAIRPPSPEFGQGWDCPLFEAKVFNVQQNLKQVETLGGKDRYFVYDPRTDSWKHFFSDDWKGEAKGDDFELTYKTGCKFVFNKGLISSMTTPDGRTILWNRDGDKLISLQESGKSPAMQIVYDSLGFAKQILFNPDNMGVAKKTFDFSSSLIYAGIDKIQCPDGRAIAFDRTRDKSLNPVMTWTDTLHLPVTLGWSAKTGKILRDNQYTYQITELSNDKTWPKMFRKNRATGKIESYYFDEKHGTTDETLADGTIRHIEMIQAPGPNYKTVRLIQDTKDGKTQIMLRRAFDDQGHLLLEAMGLPDGKEAVKQYVYDDAGRIVSYLWNGKEMWKNIYDPATGQLMERDLPNLGIKVAFDQLPGGDVKESIQKVGGAVTTTKMLAPNDWQATVSSMEKLE